MVSTGEHLWLLVNYTAQADLLSIALAGLPKINVSQGECGSKLRWEAVDISLSETYQHGDYACHLFFFSTLCS